MKLTINSDESLSRAIGSLRDEYRNHRYLQINVRAGTDRSISQNALSHSWYYQISRELREDTPKGVKAQCKLDYGVPILRAADPELSDYFYTLLKYRSYEDRLKIIEHVPVTSLMTKSQLSEYLETVQAAYADRVRLEFPQELEAAA